MMDFDRDNFLGTRQIATTRELAHIVLLAGIHYPDMKGVPPSKWSVEHVVGTTEALVRARRNALKTGDNDAVWGLAPKRADKGGRGPKAKPKR